MNLLFWRKKNIKNTPDSKVSVEMPVVKRPTAEFDIEGMDVFAIERNSDYYGCSVIGFVYNNKVQEWFLPCTLEQHNGFIQRFSAKVERIEAARRQKNDDIAAVTQRILDNSNK